MGQEYAFGAVIDDRPAITENFAAKQSIDGRFAERPPSLIDVAERVLANPKAADAERTNFDGFSSSGSNLLVVLKFRVVTIPSEHAFRYPFTVQVRPRCPGVDD